MEAMYERCEIQRLSKLEALRQSWLAMLGGELQGGTGQGEGSVTMTSRKIPKTHGLGIATRSIGHRLS
ncbi:MAG: hypothetical protein AB2687_03515 [Candidatus Thiodiazotropha taylori]